MTKQPKGVYTSNAIPVKLSMAFFTELERIFQFVWKHKTSWSQHNPEKWKWNWGSQATWLQIALQSFSHQTMVIAPKQKYRAMEQNRKLIGKSKGPWLPVVVQSLSHVWLFAISWSVACQGPLSSTNGHLVYDKVGKIVQWRKNSTFNKWYWENWTATM